MINRKHELSIVRQGKLLDLSRSSVYYSHRPVSDGDLPLMRRIDEPSRLFLCRELDVARTSEGLIGFGAKRVSEQECLGTLIV